MLIKKLTLSNYRNILFQNMDFTGDINLIIEYNSQGKTNILEAIFFLSTGRSFRNRKDQYIVKTGENESKIMCSIDTGILLKDLKILINLGRSNQFFINEKQISKATDYIGNLNAMLIAPEDLLLVKSDSQIRRRFMDIAISQINRKYLKYITDVYKCTRQRNYLIREKPYKNSVQNEMKIWEDQIIEKSEHVCQKRMEFIQYIDCFTQNRYEKMTSGREKTRIFYLPGITNDIVIKSGKYYQEGLIDAYNKNRELEIKRGASMYGPHRDDFLIELNGNNAKHYGSQGQQRSLVVSMKLAEWDFLCESLRYSPVLLVDDIFAELDDKRRSFLLEQFPGNTQMFITGTRKDDFPGLLDRAHLWTIADGKVT